MTTIIRPFMEGIIMFAILCAVLQANPLLAFVCAIVYGTTGLLYTACNILFQKLFGKTNSNRGPSHVYLYAMCTIGSYSRYYFQYSCMDFCYRSSLFCNRASVYRLDRRCFCSDYMLVQKYTRQCRI